MVFFLTAALYVVTRLVVEDEVFGQRRSRAQPRCSRSPISPSPSRSPGSFRSSARSGNASAAAARCARPQSLVLLIVPLLILWLYDSRVEPDRRVALGERHHDLARASRAQRRVHQLGRIRAQAHPISRGARDVARDDARLDRLRADDRLASSHLSGPTRAARRCCGVGSLGGLAYTYVVVTVERVDYYMYLLLPLCALVIGALVARFVRGLARSMPHRPRGMPFSRSSRSSRSRRSSKPARQSRHTMPTASRPIATPCS